MSLLNYCKTEVQREVIEAYERLGSSEKAAKELDRDAGNVRTIIRRVKKVAAKNGYAPESDMTRTAAEGFTVKGVSTLYNADGQISAQWVKTSQEAEDQLACLEQAIQARLEDIEPVKTPKLKKAKLDTDLIPWIQIGDGHLGMLASEAETLQNFDLKIAERELCAAISILVDECRPCERVVVNDLGDMTHYENFSGTTEASGHSLDTDGRFPKMIDTYTRVMIFIVKKCLEKFKYVDVIINQGNHSRTNDIWARRFLAAIFGDTDRVHVLNNDSVFIPYRMGNTFVMTHHSDKCKPAKLASVMATDYSKHWGEAEYRYIDIGHIHHGMVLKEHAGVSVESWNQLAAPDKYAHDGGWRSRQSITMVFRSKKYGDQGRRVLPVLEVRDRIQAETPKSKKKAKAKDKVYSV